MTFQLFTHGFSMVDVTRLTRFGPIAWDDGKLILHCTIPDQRSPVVWRKIEVRCVSNLYDAAGTLLPGHTLIGMVGVQSKVYMAFLDPANYDSDIKQTDQSDV
jgi:hypothetical protein